MNTFYLFRGTVTISEDRISIKGDRARRQLERKVIVFILVGLLAFCQTVINYHHYTRDGAGYAADLYFSASLAVIWLFVLIYFGLLRNSVKNDISLADIKKVKQTISSNTGYPELRIYLNNRRIRHLEFGSSGDIGFIEVLKERGVTIS